MKKYDADNLETQIDPRGHNRWKWLVAEKGKAPIKSGETSGARWRAEAEASAAMDKLILDADD